MYAYAAYLLVLMHASIHVLHHKVTYTMHFYLHFLCKCIYIYIG